MIPVLQIKAGGEEVRGVFASGDFFSEKSKHFFHLFFHSKLNKKTMGFENLDKDTGVTTLNSYLEDKSYIEG